VNILIRPTRRVLSVAVAIAALGVLASCGRTAPTAQTPASSPAKTASVAPKVSPVPTPAPAGTSGVIAATKTVVTTIAPSGDAVLDAMDKDLTALEQESISLDSAVAVSQEPAK
jgi:predicted small lipoprotein YifL